MSNLRDIMDVDVEPLESQAYRKAQEAAEQEASRRGPITSPTSPSSPSLEGKGKAPIRRRRSSRVSKSSAPTSSSASASASATGTAPARLSTGRRRSSATSDAMDYSSQSPAGGAFAYQSSPSGSSQQHSGGQESAADVPVKYTPVTGRISRAKKGVPVHTCEICRPVKTFTRAEHLRRHQLSHQKPAYPCTFEDCERAFHRPDLLARHQNRHETQGEKPHKAGQRSSRASSSASERYDPGLKSEPGQESSTGFMSPSSSAPMGSRPSGANDNTTAKQNYDPTTTTSSFPPVNNYPSTSQGTPLSPSGLGASRNPNPATFDTLATPFTVPNPSNIPDQDPYSRPTPLEFSFSGPDDLDFSNYTSLQALPLLRIPEETLMPGLTHTQDNSPWCSSASDSTFSDQWVPRGRSTSVATIPEWSTSAIHTQSWVPQMTVTPSHDLRSSSFDPLADHFETPYPSPRVSSPTFSRQLLDLPNNMYGGNHMESVGTRPSPSMIEMSIAQLNSASPSRISVAGLARLGNRAKGVVEQLGGLGSHPEVPAVSFDSHVTDYWTYFDPLFPIIHRGTFKHRFSSDPGAGNLLEAAMAAIGTQYSDSPDIRRKGTEIHSFCRRNIDLCPWNLQTMQAILLTELFKTFRARKTSVKPSRQFEELCKRLLQLLTSSESQHSLQAPNLSSHDRWSYWVEQEAHRRLLSGCFIYDCHQAMYHEQPRLASLQTESIISFLTVPCPENWWSAPTSSLWQASNPLSSTLNHDLTQERMDPYVTSAKSAFTQLLLISSLASHLPGSHRGNLGDLSLLEESTAIERITRVFPCDPLANTYLALHYTPLCDLLAVTGETWVFSRKLTPPSAFTTAKARLKTWSSSKAAASATKYACTALRSFLLENRGTCTRNTRRQISYSYGLSYYWGLYTCALICWAFGYRHQTPTTKSLPTSRSSSAKREADAKVQALAYVDSMLCVSEAELLTPTAVMKSETAGVITLVISRLEEDGIGDQTMAIVDAIDVLKRLGEPGRGKWF